MNAFSIPATGPTPRQPGPWIMAQTWHNLLFAHWPVPAEMIQPHLPPGVQLDTYDGQAWIGIVAFWLSGIRLRGLPPVPFTSCFPEINVRTYVRAEDTPAVLFLSLDADNVLGITLAKQWYHLRYRKARISVASHGDTITFASRREEAHAAPAQFTASYAPTAPACPSQPGSLAYWLTERYRLYTSDRQGRLYRADVAHTPWPLHQAEADIRQNTMALSHNILLPDTPPLLHYAQQMQAFFQLPAHVHGTPIRAERSTARSRGLPQGRALREAGR